MLRVLLLVTVWCLVGLCLVTAAQAELVVPDLSLSAVAAAGGNPGVGGCLTYPVLRLSNARVFVDLGVLADGPQTVGFFGLSTDKALPLVKQLPGDACVGVGWAEPTDTWLVYLRYEVF